MAPKSIKSAAEKRATRGPNSAWSKDGLKKAARTDRWYKWTYPTPSSPIQEFIATHNIPRAEALSVLSAHYEKYVPCLHSEGNVDTSKQGASGSCFGYGQSSSSSDQPMLHFRDAVPLSQLGLLLIWIMPLPWASARLIRSNPLAFHYSHPDFLSTRIHLLSRLSRHVTAIPMSVECRCHLPAWGKFTMEPTDRIPTPSLRLPLLLSQPGSLMIWAMFLPWPRVFFLTRSNPVAFHNSHRTFLSIWIQPHYRLLYHATTLPMAVVFRYHLTSRGNSTAEATVLIPTSAHRLSLPFLPNGSRYRRCNRHHVPKNYLRLHPENPTIEHLRFRSNMAIQEDV